MKKIDNYINKKCIRKLISCLLVVSILFTSISPISLAVYEYGPDKSMHVINWKNLPSNTGPIYDPLSGGISYPGGGVTFYPALETIPIQVTESGIYSVSNVFGGNVNGNFFISARYGDASLKTTAPLPIATYGKAGESTTDLTKYNNKASKSASVYLEAGKIYYISFVGDTGSTLHGEASSDSATSQAATLNMHIDYIEPKAGEQVYETEISSAKYTAPGVEGAFYIGNGNDDLVITGRIQRSANIQSISGDKINAQLAKASELDGDQNASWFEQVLTWFVLLLCDCFRSAITAALNEPISIDSVLFNKYSSTRLSIFKSNRDSGNKNGYLEASGMLDSGEETGIITDYFMLFRKIAIAVYIVMLLYMGVRVLLSSTGNKKERYKTMMVDWVKGIIILGFFPYIMKYSIVINDAIVDYIYEVKANLPSQVTMPTLSGVSASQGTAMNVVNSTMPQNGDIMESMRITAKDTGRLAYAMIYLLLIKELLGFVYIYFKRLISVIFLIIIFPLVTISYAVDKIGDGKSQAFNNWFNEFILNIFLQSFQAVNYIIVMSIIFALTTSGGTANVILMLVGFEYISKGDEILRSMFSKMSGGNAQTLPKSLQEAGKTVATVKIAKDLAKKVGSVGKRVTNLRTSVNETRKKYYSYQESIHQEYLAERRQQEYIRNQSNEAVERRETADISGNIEKALNLSGARSGEDVKVALDRLGFAMNDNNLKARVEAEFSNLSDEDKEKLKKLLAANESINAEMNGNVGVRGALTEAELNIKANIECDILEGKDKGLYKDLYKFIASKNILDSDGNLVMENGRPLTLETAIRRNVNRRSIDSHGQEQLEKLQKFTGNVTQIDTSRFGGKGVSLSRENLPTTRRRESAKEMASARTIQKKFGIQGAGKESEKLQERTAMFVARMQAYKFKMDQGTMEGLSPTEMMQLATEWEQLAKIDDEGVKSILAQVGDIEERKAQIAKERGISVEEVEEKVNKSEYKMEANLGVNMQQFKAMASVNVFKNKAYLEGTDEEIHTMLNEAGKTILEIDMGRKVDAANTSNSSYKVDKVAKAVIQRAELDDFIDTYKRQVKNGAVAEELDFSEYIITNETQEEIRDRKEYARRVRNAEMDYDSTNRTTVEGARLDFYRSAGKTAVAAVDTTLGAATSLAMGVTTAAMNAGISGKTDPLATLGATSLGTDLSHGIEKLIMGTNASNSSPKSFGAQTDNYLKNKANEMGTMPYEQRNQAFVQKQKNREIAENKSRVINNRLRNR
ncbi:MAG: hypothetical protein J6C46_10760 [Clostridia bacterium]|nr:hypothetical protein [Clostridia bacterium]